MSGDAGGTIGSDEARELAEMYGEPFTAEWRLGHAIEGDAAMSEVAELVQHFGAGDRDDDTAVAVIISAMAQVAQAHYAAANVRAKPGWLKAPKAEDLDDAPRPGHGQYLVEDTGSGRIVYVPAGLEVSPEEALALKNVGITLVWEGAA